MAAPQCYYCTAPITATEDQCPNCRQPLVLHNRYRLERVLGLGGFGVVYAAIDLRLNRPCAVKGVASVSLADQKRIEGEASILSRYASQFYFIPDVYDIWSDKGQTFLVMEYIDGETLDRLLVQPWPSAQVEEFLHAQLGYLAQLHAVGIIHRDLKPQNIKRTSWGRYVLLDFGIAKQGAVTMTAAKALSPDYASPEQVSGHHTDGRSDLYSLAATAYHLLTGRPPVNVLVRLSTGATPEPPAQLVPGVSSALGATLLRMLELEPADRPANAQEALCLLTGEAAGSVPLPGPNGHHNLAAPPSVATPPDDRDRPTLLPSVVQFRPSGQQPAPPAVAANAREQALADLPTQSVAVHEAPTTAVNQRPRRAGRRWLWGGVPVVALVFALAWAYQARATDAASAQTTQTAQARQQEETAQSVRATQTAVTEQTAQALLVAQTAQAGQTTQTTRALVLAQTVQAGQTSLAARLTQTALVTATVETPTTSPSPTLPPRRGPTRTPTLTPEPPTLTPEPPPPTPEPVVEPQDDEPRPRPPATPVPPTPVPPTPVPPTEEPTSEPTEEPYPPPEPPTAEPPTAEPPTEEPPTEEPTAVTVDEPTAVTPTDEPPAEPTSEPTPGS